ncbi:MAG: hypothetical protein HZA54_09000 [Planctomycetes bacterium]|nr:hypothetical protein [Planctomycetota bacterium]
MEAPDPRPPGAPAVPAAAIVTPAAAPATDATVRSPIERLRDFTLRIALPGRAPLLHFFIYLTALLIALQFSTPDLVDTDSYFHARFANLLPWMGLNRGFAWTQDSLWRDAFVDKDFLFHVLLAPFCASENEGSVVIGAKIAAVLFALAIFGAFYRTARQIGLTRPVLWTFVLLSAGSHFLFRLLEVRGHMLSVLLVVLAVPVILAESTVGLFLYGFIYAWSYAAPQLLVGLVAAHGAAQWLRGGAFPGRALLAAAVGVFLGLLCHPYTLIPPYTFDVLTFWYVQNVVVLGQAWGLAEPLPLRAGNELQAVSTRSVLSTSTGALAAWLGGVAGLTLGRRSPSGRTASLFAMSAATFVLYLLSAKFVEYFAPLAVLFGASAIEDQIGDWRLRMAARTRNLRALALFAGAALLLAAAHVRTVRDVRSRASDLPPPAMASAANWMREHLPADATVINLNWNDFSTLFFFDTKHHYISGLDPSFQAAVDVGGALYLEDVRLGRKPLSPKELGARFRAEYAVLNLQDYAVQRELADLIGKGYYPDARMEYCEDGRAAVFRIVK